MMKILPAGPEKNGLSGNDGIALFQDGGLLSSRWSAGQTTWTNPDMYPKAFIGPPNEAMDVPHGNSQFQA